MTPLELAPRLVLASTSPYRAAQLRGLGVAFDCVAPDTDETARPGEAPHDLARRLAVAKAESAALRAVAPALFIGGDQVASVGSGAGVTILGKPGSPARARAQLALCSGREVTFHSAIAVADRRDPARRPATAVEVDTTHVKFRDLDAALIAHYVALESPLDCAGSFRAERLGRLLFEHVRTDDPDALVGMPVLALARLLRALGVDLLACSDFSLPPSP